MSTKEWVEVFAIAVIVIGVVGVFVDRWRAKRGIGVRVIQFLALVLVVPTVLILALEKVLAAETVGTLLGAIVGYVLSGIGKDETTKSGN